MQDHGWFSIQKFYGAWIKLRNAKFARLSLFLTCIYWTSNSYAIHMVPLKGNTVLTHNRLAYLVCKSIKQCVVVCINLSSSLLYAWKLMHGVLNHFMRGTYSTYGLWSMVYGLWYVCMVDGIVQCMYCLSYLHTTPVSQLWVNATLSLNSTLDHHRPCWWCHLLVIMYLIRKFAIWGH